MTTCDTNTIDLELTIVGRHFEQVELLKMTRCDIIHIELTIVGRHLVVEIKITTCCDVIYLEFHQPPQPLPL